MFQSALTGGTAMLTWLTALPPLTAFSVTADTIVGNGDLVYLPGALRVEIRTARSSRHRRFR